MRTTLLLLLLPPLALLLQACDSDVAVTPYVPPDQRLVLLYQRVPALENCYPGILRDTESVKVLAALNALRTLHFSPPTLYNPAPDSVATLVALAAAANGGLPRAGGTCATPDLATHLANSVVGWSSLPQTGDVVSSAGLIERMFMTGGTEARAAMIDPFLKEIAFGRVDGPTPITDSSVSAGALYVGLPAVQSLHGWLHQYVAYPFETYPARYFDSTFEMFIVVVVDRERPEMRAVDFDRAIVRVETAERVPLPVTVTTRRKTPNLLAWRAPIEPDTLYWVSIDSAVVDGVVKNYAYQVRLQ